MELEQFQLPRSLNFACCNCNWHFGLQHSLSQVSVLAKSLVHSFFQLSPEASLLRGVTHLSSHSLTKHEKHSQTS